LKDYLHTGINIEYDVLVASLFILQTVTITSPTALPYKYLSFPVDPKASKIPMP